MELFGGGRNFLVESKTKNRGEAQATATYCTVCVLCGSSASPTNTSEIVLHHPQSADLLITLEPREARFYSPEPRSAQAVAPNTQPTWRRDETF